MKKTLKNIQMLEMITQLKPLLSHRDKIGYAAARNYRIFANSLTEYMAFRNALIEKYGETGKDDDDQSIVQISVNSPKFKMFCDELEPYNNTEHEVDLMIAKYDDAINVLTGEEILSIDWMLED